MLGSERVRRNCYALNKDEVRVWGNGSNLFLKGSMFFLPG